MALPLHSASRNGDLELARKLIIVEKFDVNERDQHSRTPLHLASWAGHADIVQLLCENGAQVNATAADDMAAIHFAAQKGHVNALKMLLAGGAKVTLHTRKGLTSLHFAVQGGHNDVIRVIVRRSPALLGEQTNKGQRPIDLAKSNEIRLFLEDLVKGIAREKEKAKAGKEKPSPHIDRGAEDPIFSPFGDAVKGVQQAPCRAREEENSENESVGKEGLPDSSFAEIGDREERSASKRVLGMGRGSKSRCVVGDVNEANTVEGSLMKKPKVALSFEGEDDVVD